MADALVFAFLFTSCKEDHLTFDGIPICGTQKQFGAKLEEKGYTQLKGGCPSYYEGEFTWKPVSLIVYDTKGSVYKVLVAFSSKYSRGYVFDSYKESLTEKYGSCSEREKYDVVFDTELGEINLRLDKMSVGDQLILTYTDRKGQIQSYRNGFPSSSL